MNCHTAFAAPDPISALPAEVIRKGRFDQVFFVDLIEQRQVEVEETRTNMRTYLEQHPEPLRGDRPDIEKLDIETCATGPMSKKSRGGMRSKLTAAKMAAVIGRECKGQAKELSKNTAL